MATESTVELAVAVSVTPAHCAIRRKPKFTYRSPSAALTTFSSPRIETISVASRPPRQHQQFTLVSAPETPAPLGGEGIGSDLKSKSVKKYYSMAPPLPLYHPLGRLALSLPDLDHTTLGLPAPPRPYSFTPITPSSSSSSARRSSVRARRPTTKMSGAIEAAAAAAAAGASVTVSATITGSASIAFRASTEPASTASPAKDKDKGKERDRDRETSRRKRSSTAKRKKKEVDEDATYPAKRPRNARRAGAGESESSPTGEDAGGGEQMEPPEENGKPPSRRSARSRGNARRRDSSTSEATAASVSVKTRGPENETVEGTNGKELENADITTSKTRSHHKEEEEMIAE